MNCFENSVYIFITCSNVSFYHEIYVNGYVSGIICEMLYYDIRRDLSMVCCGVVMMAEIVDDGIAGVDIFDAGIKWS